MKNCKIALIIGAFFLSLSCKKVNENVDPTENAASILRTASNGMRVATTGCTPAPVDDVNNFSIQNQVADAPISPATGGTIEQNARNNYEKIQWCLVKYGKALLNSGEFVINHVLVLDNADLMSANGDWPTIKAISSYSNAMIKVNNNSRVAFLTLNANKNFLLEPNSSVIGIGGDGNQIDNNWIKGGDVPLYRTDAGRIAGVYIMCGDDNLVWNNKITNNHSGVIITKPDGFATPLNNIVKENDLFLNRSDGITLVTYGQVLNNKIYMNGWDCQNGGGGSPIPGAGIYAEHNHNGALIQENTIYDNTGHNIDLTDIQHFSILNNTVYNPGNSQIPGINDVIVTGGAISVCLADASYCVVEGNDIRNENRPNNAVGGGDWWGHDINKFFSESADSLPYSDLPFGGNSIIAFGLVESRCNNGEFVVNQVQQNTIRNNIFIASPNGIGYFASRNTGFDPDHSWSAATTNYYTLNNPNGSNVGSVRCGGNWYAANGVDANTDDFQHQPPSSSWSGNDFKNWYDGTCAP
jgi:hypothetical protein